MRRIRFLISCACLASALAWSQGQAQERLKISYSSIDAPNANWYIAEDKELYQKYGLDTDLVFISSLDNERGRCRCGVRQSWQYLRRRPRECRGRRRRSGLRRFFHQHPSLRVGR